MSSNIKYSIMAILIIICLQIIQIVQLGWHFIHTRDYIRQQVETNIVFLDRAETFEKRNREILKATRKNQEAINRINIILGIEKEQWKQKSED